MINNLAISLFDLYRVEKQSLINPTHIQINLIPHYWWIITLIVFGIALFIDLPLFNRSYQRIMNQYRIDFTNRFLSAFTIAFLLTNYLNLSGIINQHWQWLCVPVVITNLIFFTDSYYYQENHDLRRDFSQSK